MNKNKRIKKTALVTGATGGIGRQIALKFASEGWGVICHYNSSSKNLLVLQKEMKKYKDNVRFLKADFSSKKDLRNFTNKVKRLKIDSLINNAGTYVGNRHFSNLKIEDVEKTFMVNTIAPALLATSVFKGMKKSHFGRIVNISSIAAKYGGSSKSMDYGCSKLAVEGVTKTLAREGAKFNILVNTLRPGVIDTDFHKKFPKDMKKRVSLIPVKRMGNPCDVAEMAYYLGSEINGFISGEIVTIAGGE